MDRVLEGREEGISEAQGGQLGSPGDYFCQRLASTGERSVRTTTGTQCLKTHKDIKRWNCDYEKDEGRKR